MGAFLVKQWTRMVTSYRIEDKRLDPGVAASYNPEVINLQDGTFLLSR